MSRKVTIKVLSIFLSLALVFSIIPSEVFAIKIPHTANTDIEEETNSQILGEDISKREENVKHFMLSDGSSQAVVYSIPIHHRVADKWLDIDNTLIYKDKLSFSEESGYTTTSGLFSAEFAYNSNSDNLLKIADDDYSILLKIPDAKNKMFGTKAKVIDKKEITDVYSDAIKNTVSVLEYNNILKDTNLKYTVTPAGIKEDIILNSLYASSSIEFELYTEGTVIKTNEDSSISFISKTTGDIVFHIPSPYMYDNKNNYSDNVHYEINDKDNGWYSFKIIADKEWLDSTERQFPVTIDPTFEYDTTHETVHTSFINSRNPNDNYASTTDMQVGYSSPYYHSRILTKYILPKLNKGDIIINAQACFAVVGYSAVPANNQLIVSAHNINSTWDNIEIDDDGDGIPDRFRNIRGTAKWSDNISYGEALDYKKMGSSSVSKWQNFDITKAAKGWYDNSVTNNGIMLKSYNESLDSSNNCATFQVHSERQSYARINNLDVYETDEASNRVWYSPRLVITYRNNKGLEKYWSYTNLSAGAAGTANINDYTGNLVFEAPLVSDTNELMSTGLSLVYNGYCAGERNVNNKNSNSQTTPGRGFRLNIQSMVLPSSVYGLTGDSATTYPYVYTDGDGTEHYFKVMSESDEDYAQNKYKDEDGLGLTLTKNSDNTYTINDKSDNKLYFRSNGNIYQYSDANGHNTKIVYMSSNASTGVLAYQKISYVESASGHRFTFGYSSADYLNTITDSAGRVTTINRDSAGCISSVVYADGTRSEFEYDSDKALTTATDNEGFSLQFSYTSLSKGKRVSIVREYGSAGNLGQKISFDRSKYNQTTIQTQGNDGTFDTDDDIITRYQFDNLGRTVTQQVSLKNGTSAGAAVCKYTTTDTSTSANGRKNKVSTEAGLGKNTVNMLANGNCESTSNWTTGKSNDNVSTSFGNSTTYSYYGAKSIYIHNTSLSSGESAYYKQTCNNITGGSKYTLSAYVKTSSLSLVAESLRSGAYIKVIQYNGSNEISSEYSSCIREATDTSIDKGWRRLSATISTDENANKLVVYLYLRNATGYAYFDGVQLETGSAPNSFNFIENSSFEKYSSHMPSSWDPVNVAYSVNSSGTVLEGISDVSHKNGSYSMRINGDADVGKNITQTIPVEGNINDTYIISGWSNGQSVSDTFHDDLKYEIGVVVNYKGANNNTVSQEKDAAEFNTSVDGWQYSSVIVPLKYKAAEGENTEDFIPKSISIRLRYSHNANKAYFDLIQVIKEPAPSYTYDKDGNVLSVAENAEQKQNMKYTANSDLSKFTDAKGNEYEYEYDNNHNITKATSARGVVTNITYNSSKLPSSEEITNSTGTLAIKTDTLYNTSNDNANACSYVTTVKDTDGNSTKYTYDYSRGRTKSVTTPDGTVTDYTYVSNNNDRISKVASNGSEVRYSYSGNRLANIIFRSTTSSTQNETYSFEYNQFGNRTKTSVGTQILAQYYYGSHNGQLDRIRYGNGDSLQYSYNSFGNVSSLKKYISDDNTTTLYSWNYNSAQTPVAHTDYVNDLKHDYVYDSIGRIVKENIIDKDTEEQKASTEYTYDMMNNITKLAFAANGNSSAQNYYYSAISGNTASTGYAKDNLPTRYSMSSSRYVDYDYDGLNRLTNKSLQLNGRVIYSDYKYKLSDRNTSSSNKYRTTLIGSEYIGDDVFEYTYDVMGNITAISNGTRTNAGTNIAETTGTNAYRSYEYDELNQLTRENNKTENKTHEFEYDALGNIKSRKDYAYTTSATLSSPVKTVSYRYGNGGNDGFNYLLTGVDFNGSGVYDSVTESISYDEIGNPTSYFGNTLTWYGRQLNSYADRNNHTYTYKYNADGLRTSKTTKTGSTVTGTSKYIYSGDRLMYENKNGTDIYYYYDSYGSFSAMKWHDSSASVHWLYAVTNSQGDVIGLYDNNGTLRIRYEYDAWGNIIAETNASGGSLSTTYQSYSDLNPFRYRGYYYDSETGLYYLQSRYYNPKVGRFLNADGYITTGQGILSYNMFAYCGNNPVMFIDFTGNCSCKYDGSVADFHRLEQGLPPLSCTHHIDITEKLDNALRDNAKDFSDYIESHNYVESAKYFCEQVRPGGNWDFKSQESWNLNDEVTYYYNGDALRYDALGNINYGYVGSLLFSDTTLKMAAGMVQIYKKTSSYSYMTTYFDDPYDQQMIDFGISLWDRRDS